MKTLLYVACWFLVLAGIVLGAVALGLVGGAPAVCGFLAVVLVGGGITAIVGLNQSVDAPEVEVVAE